MSFTYEKWPKFKWLWWPVDNNGDICEEHTRSHWKARCYCFVWRSFVYFFYMKEVVAA